VVNTAMEGALRVISVERGHDPADFALVAFGGAAGLHAAELAGRLGIPRVLVPPDPGVLSALGMLVSPVRKDLARSVLLRGDAARHDVVDAAFADLEHAARSAMVDEGVEAGQVQVRRLADVRYVGQSYELTVPAEEWGDAFHRLHAERYGFHRAGAEIELVTLRVQAAGPPTTVPRSRPAGAPDVRAPGHKHATVRYRGSDVTTPIIDRAALAIASRTRGPAVIHEYSATFWLPPDWEAEVLANGSLSANAVTP
jgi:N-methylhydantoinase A